jgi:REP element-mobilizing transposase RayT
VGAQHAALLLDSDMKVHYPRSIRLKGYDYAQAGAYFVTICTHGQDCLLGEIVDEEMMLSSYGKVAKTCFEEIPLHFAHAELDAFVIMPNHLHGIIVLANTTEVAAQHAAPLRNGVSLRPAPGSLSTIVRSFKSASTRRINELRAMEGTHFWQRDYYEHVIRNDRDMDRIRGYITTNPLKWSLDRENPQKTGTSSVEDALFGIDHAP